MSWRRHMTDIVLLGVAVALTGVVAWDRGRVTTAEAERRRLDLLDAWRPDEVKTIEVTRGSERFVLTHDGVGSWSLTVNGEPVPVDDLAVQSALVSLEFAGFERVVEGLDRGSLGLDPPSHTIAVSMPPLAYTIRVGGEAPSPPGAHYVEVEGGPRGTRTYVVRKEVVEELPRAAADYRSRRFVPYLSLSVEAYDVRHAGAEFRLERGGWGGRTAGAFQLVQDRLTVRADDQLIDGWISSLASLEAQTFRTLPERDPDDAAVIALTGRGEPDAKLVIGGACDDPSEVLVVRRGVDPVAGCAPRDVTERLLVLPEALFDRHVIGTAAGDITDLRLEAGDTVVDVARKGEGWHMRTPDAGDVDDEAMAALLRELIDATGMRLPRSEAEDLAALGLDPPRGRLVLRGLAERAADDAEAREEIVEVGAEDDGGIYLRRRDDGHVLRVPAAVGRAFLPRPSALRSLVIYDRPLRGFRGLTLACGHRQRMTRTAAGSWNLEVPDLRIGPDLADANDFCDGIRQLRALRWEAETALDEHELSDPWCTIEATYLAPGSEDGAEPETMRIELGAATVGGYYARTGDGPAVFVAPRVVGSRASRWLLDRTAILPDLGEVAGVTLARGDRTLEVTVEGGRWLVPTMRGFGEQIRRTLGDLVAEGVVTVGAPLPEQGFDDPRLTITVARPHADEPERWIVGRGEVWRDTTIFYVRRKGIDATFAVAQARIRPLLDGLGGGG